MLAPMMKRAANIDIVHFVSDFFTILVHCIPKTNEKQISLPMDYIDDDFFPEGNITVQ